MDEPVPTGPADIGTPPTAHDVLVQIRSSGGAIGYCSLAPAAKVKATKTGLRFRDPKRQVASAQGLQRLSVKRKRTGAVAFAAAGRSAPVPTLPPGVPVHVSLGIRTAGSAVAQCRSVTATLRATKRGLRFP